MNPVTVFIFILAAALVTSTTLYLFLRHKTKIETRYLYIDNPSVAMISAFVVFILFKPHLTGQWIPAGALLICSVGFLAFVFTMIRFWRQENHGCYGTDCLSC